MALTMKIKKLIEAVRQINGKRLCEATGITLGLAFVITTICFLGKYAPAVLLILLGVFLIIVFYFLLEMLEE